MDIPEIKEKLSILSVLKNNRLNCPFHDDKSPSLQVYPETSTWTCFSSKCTAGSGDQIDFIMKRENISKHEAILKAKTMSGYVEPEKTPKQENRLSESQRSETLTKAFTHFVRSLTAKPL